MPNPAMNVNDEKVFIFWHINIPLNATQVKVKARYKVLLNTFPFRATKEYFSPTSTRHPGRKAE